MNEDRDAAREIALNNGYRAGLSSDLNPFDVAFGVGLGFDAGYAFAANPWREIKSADDLPTDGSKYWVTYVDFYKNRSVHIGYRRSDGTWRLNMDDATTFVVSSEHIEATMPYVEPEPFVRLDGI